MFPPSGFRLRVLCSRLHEVCSLYRREDQKLSVKAARALKIKGAFIFSVVLQRISNFTFVIAIQLCCRPLEEEHTAISTRLKYFTFPCDCISFSSAAHHPGFLCVRFIWERGVC